MTGKPFDLVEARTNRGLTTKSAARETGVHEHVMRALEGKIDRAVQPDNAKKVADYFGVQVTDLIDPHTYKSIRLGVRS